MMCFPEIPGRYICNFLNPLGANLLVGGAGINSSIFLNIWDTFGPQVFLGVFSYIRNKNTFEKFQN